MICEKFFFLLFALLVTGTANYVQALDGEGIVGGDLAETKQFSHQVAILNRDSDYKFRCGGSILDDYHVLTAAHCIEERPQFIVAGVVDLNKTQSDDPKRIEIDFERAFVHHGYYISQKKRVFKLYDVAVVVLKESLNLKNNPHLAKVKLATEDSGSFEGETAVVSGFGYNNIEIAKYRGKKYEYMQYTEGKLRWARTKVPSIDECQCAYKDLENNLKLDPRYHICAHIEQRKSLHNRGEGICTGDSGGALISNGIQIGIINQSPFGCREVDQPSIYARVSAYHDFIIDAMNDDPRPPYTEVVY